LRDTQDFAAAVDLGFSVASSSVDYVVDEGVIPLVVERERIRVAAADC